jgi:4-hydroxybenzoyl-CoA thioesterase
VLCGFEFVDEEGKTTLSGEVTLVNVAFNENRNDIKAEPFSEEIKVRIKNFEL